MFGKRYTSWHFCIFLESNDLFQQFVTTNSQDAALGDLPFYGHLHGALGYGVAGSYFVGNKSADKLPRYGGAQVPARDKPYVRINIQHIAIQYHDNEPHIAGMLERIDAVLEKHVDEKGYNWEYNVLEPDREKWEINGIKPPRHGSEEEKKWFHDEKPSRWP
ncbi:hypothetical protein PG984_010897 [Apiospora sp. TS-2023a]